ncbi:hypothetical protein, partial [Salmonella sp. NW877]
CSSLKTLKRVVYKKRREIDNGAQGSWHSTQCAFSACAARHNRWDDGGSSGRGSNVQNPKRQVQRVLRE